MPNPTIVVSHLDDKELRASIDALVNYVGNNTTVMAEQFRKAIDLMNGSMKNFAITQKVSVDLMKQAWRDMSSSFDAMVKAQSGATGGGIGQGKVYAPNTVGALEQEIALETKKRKEMELGTEELRNQNQLLEQRKKALQFYTTSDVTKISKAYQKRIGDVVSLPSKSFSDANEKLRRLRELLDDMQKRPFLFSEAKINRVKNAIDSVETKIERMRKKWGGQGQQPNTLQNVLGMDESSFDAIAKKMAALKKLSWSNPQEQKAIVEAYQKLRLEQNKLLASNARMARSNNYLAQSFGYIRNRIVYALTLGAISQFTKDIVRIRAEYEMLERSLGILVDDMDKGSAIFKELNEMALKSPYTLVELGTAAKQLTAYNFAANEVVDTTRRLADIASALGVPMERLVYNLGQIKAQGVLNARDARDFANAGLAIVPMLSKMYTEQKTFGDRLISTAEVYDMMSKKMVTYNDVLKVIYKTTDEGGKFFDFQARQANTLKVQLANLTLAYNNMLNEIGSSSQGAIFGFIGGLKTMLKYWKDIARVIGTLVVTFGAYKAATSVVAALNSRMFVGSILVNLRNYVRGIKAATGAMATFNAVTKLNPIGFLVSALAAALSYFVLFKSEVEEVSDAVERFGEEGSKVLKKVDTLKNILDGTSKTSTIYKKALSELVELTEEYGVNIDKEKASREEINKGIERTIQLIKEESAERQRANQLESARTDYDTEIDNARKDLEKSLKNPTSGMRVPSKFVNDVQKNAEAVTAIIEDVVSSHIYLIKDKYGEEFRRGVVELDSIINERLDKLGIKGKDIQHLYSGTFSNTSVVKQYAKAVSDATEKLERRGQIIEKNKRLADEEIQSTMTFTQKVEANQRALRNASNDALSLYNHVYDIAEIAKKNNIISFDLQITAQNPPKWMFDKSLPELQKWAERFASIAKSGGTVRGYTREQTYQRALEYAAAARKKQEEEERRKKEPKTSQKDTIAEALKEEIALVKALQQEYDKLTKSGESHAEAIELIKDAFKETINLLDKDLQKFGLPKLDMSLIQGDDPNKTLKYFKELREVLKSKGLENLERMKVVDAVIEQLQVRARTYNLDMITKGLNSELGKLKEEYELAVSLDADPEMGSMFADLMGIDMETLPHTVNEYASRMTELLNQYLKDKKAGIELPTVDLTNDKLRTYAEMVKSKKLTEEAYEIIKKAVEEIRGLRKKDYDETIKEWNSLIDKYGDLQSKLVKITKDASSEMVGVIKKFNKDDSLLKKAMEIHAKMSIADSPNDVARLRKQLEDLMGKVVKDNPAGKKVADAISMSIRQLESKAYWEDFKNGDLYTMTFENMERLSTRAIRRIIEELDKLKDKVKEDPASMKALVKSINDARKEIIKRNPFKTITKNIGGIKKAKEEVVTAAKALGEADGKLDAIKEELDDAVLHGDQEKTVRLLKDKEQAEKNVAEAEASLIEKQNKLKALFNEDAEAIRKVSKYAQDAAGILQTLSDVVDTLGGSRDSVEVLNDLSESLNGLANVGEGIARAIDGDSLGGTAQALQGLWQSTKTWLDNSTKRTDRAIQRSEQVVRQLELAYIDLEHAMDEAYGMATIGAKKAVVANKELQLVELNRQLILEQGRRSKHRDNARIVELQKQIKELQYDIKSAKDEIVNDLLGISSVGDAMENLMDGFISALRNGEDAMAVFDESIDDMIANMVKKMFTTKILQPWFEKQWDAIQKSIEERGKGAEQEVNRLSMMTDSWIANELAYKRADEYIEKLRSQGNKMTVDRNEIARWMRMSITEEDVRKYREAAQEALTAATAPTVEDIKNFAKLLETGRPIMEGSIDEISELLKQLGVYQGAESELSALQQGIQGITEDTAGALEAYMNGVSQQVYLQSDLLTQIKETIMTFDFDAQLGVMSEMLLKLQQSYQVQQSIQGILEGALSPSGRAFNVELTS